MLAVYLCPKWLKDKNPSLKTSIQKIFDREEALRYNEMGYNCYIYPNDPKNVTDSEKWLTADSFTEFNSLFVDMDLKEGVYKTKEEFYDALADFPVSPRLVVDSGNGVHAYWPVETVGPLDYLKLQRKLARALKTDVAVCQLKQLMRLPGTTNTKDPGNFKACEVVFESDDQEPLSAKVFDKIPGLSKEDVRYCEEHFDKAFNKTTAETSELKDLPESFVKLLKEDEYASSLWYRTNGKDRSSNDMALARLLHERDFSKEEAIQVLVNSDKVEDRNDRSKISYAENTVNKVWDAPSNKPKVEQTSIDDYDIFEIAQTVEEILKEKEEEEASKRLACHPAIDNTVHGLRLGQVIGLVGGSGIGKCLGKDTPIIMYDGTIKMVQDVKPGDLLMGPDSTPRTVLNTVVGQDQLYRVVQNNGNAYVVNSEHIISLKKSTNEPRYGKTQGEIIDIPIKDYINSSEKFKASFKGFKVGVEFPAANLPIDPYFLGMWLGDGSSEKPDVTTMDPEVKQAFFDFAANYLNFQIRGYKQENNKSTTYRLTFPRGQGNPVLATLQSLNLINNKHIPQSFKTASTAQRLELLAGLVDTDGFLSNNCYEITQKNEDLAADIVYLARSLGFGVSVSRGEKSCQTGAVGLYSRITISGDLVKIPVKVARRKAAPRKQIKNVLNTGIWVEDAGYGDFYGFEIDGDKRFLLGDFTVTHNTTLALNMFHWFAERNQDKVHMFFGLEQSRGELAERWDKITKGNPDLNRKVIIVSNHVKNKPSLNLGLDDIERLILDYEKKSGHKVGCVTIDHIGLLKRKPRDTEIQGIMDASVKMKLVAERTQTLIVMQSQASRQKAGEGDIELGKSAAYGSMYFESNCDYLMTLWQPLKRLYSQGAPTVIAFKFCKIRHKNVTRDVIKEDQKYMLYFEPDSDTLSGLQEADLKHINEWWLGKAAEARGIDVDTDLTPYRSAC